LTTWGARESFPHISFTNMFDKLIAAAGRRRLSSIH